ncbi:MAG: ADP-forming succinate--CoA ligase subunit beta, partial [Hyphomicrobiales bacterium]
FQAKEILASFGIPVPVGEIVETAEQAERAARRLPGKRYAVKAQVHAGGRGKAGGVVFAASPGEAGKTAAQMLGQVLVTEQTGPQGRTVRRVYVEEAVDINRVAYVAVMVDRLSGQVVLIGASEGGEDIEERAARDPRIIQSAPVPADGRMKASDLESFARKIGFDGLSGEKAAALFAAMAKAFFELDAALIEINPLAVTKTGELVALDAKMILDDNAMFRHADLKGLADHDDLDPVELQAQANEINYVRMDGNIGVVVNGAGLALATHDMLTDAGGEAANFMDIRTTATSLHIARGFDLLLQNPNVKTVLVNVHGGGLQRCDTIAEGIGVAIKRADRAMPIVVRFAGNNADFGRTLLNNYGVRYIEADNMTDAVEKAVEVARAGRA